MKFLPDYLVANKNAWIARGVVIAAITAMMLSGAVALAATAPAQTPIILTGADRRPAISLDGEWAAIVDPYFSGLFSFHHEEKKNGWFLNQKAKPGDPFPTNTIFPRRRN